MEIIPNNLAQKQNLLAKMWMESLSMASSCMEFLLEVMHTAVIN